MCYRSIVDRAKSPKTPYMLAQKELNYKLASFLQIYVSRSPRRLQLSKTGRANLLEDNWMEVGARRHLGEYLRTRSPNEPLGNY